MPEKYDNDELRKEFMDKVINTHLQMSDGRK